MVELYQLQKDSFYSLETIQPDEESKLILEYSLFASEPVPFDPMEKAIHEAFLAQSPLIKPSEFKMVHEYPLSGIHPMMTHIYEHAGGRKVIACKGAPEGIVKKSTLSACLLYTSDAADERSSVDLGGRRIIKKKKRARERGRCHK